MKSHEFITEDKQSIAYHVTPRKNVGNILYRGLNPGRPRGAAYKEKRVWLFPSRDAAEEAMINWLGDRFQHEDEMLSLLSVDISGLDIRDDMGEYYTLDRVDPNRIKLVDEFFG